MHKCVARFVSVSPDSCNVTWCDDPILTCARKLAVLSQLSPPHDQNKKKEKLQEAQLMLENPRDSFRGQSRSPNMLPFDMLWFPISVL